MKASTFLSVITFCLLAACVGLLVLGVTIDDSRMWAKLFALFFIMGSVSFLGYLKALNQENK